MSEPFLAEVKIFGFNFPPRGWAQCDGQILPINQNQSLYSLLGTTYGGDGRTSFALPELRGRTPLHVGSGYQLGQKGGAEAVVLTQAEMPSHDHGARASSAEGNQPVAAGAVLADVPGQVYGQPGDLVELRSGTVAGTGSNQGHNNMQPYQVLNFCIALQGLFPSRN